MSDREYREIEAEYEGRCVACDEKILVGEPILWAPGRPAVHAACKPDPVEAQAAPPVGGESSATARERETGAERTAREFREKTQARLDVLEESMQVLLIGIGNLRKKMRALLLALGENPDIGDA